MEELHAFVLDGGFKHFYPEHREYCTGEYVPEFESPIPEQ
jgi:hypothetical protein